VEEWQAVTADYLRNQAKLCLAWARECFDLTTATRLRHMADEFMSKAAEIDSDQKYRSDNGNAAANGAHGSFDQRHSTA
jgi:hypothetical protein